MQVYCMQEKIIAHFLNKKLLKGFSEDFSQDKYFFNIADKDTQDKLEIALLLLKAVFFVKDFEGNMVYQEKHDAERTDVGRKVKIQFKDNETIIGYTPGFSPANIGFFLYPLDPQSNNVKIFVINANTEKILFL